MMAADANSWFAESHDASLPFSRVEIYRSRALGKGAYGAVYRAKADDLPCAAKLIHTVFFEYQDPGLEEMVKKFLEECKLLSTLVHPNIVQFLGVAFLSEPGRTSVPVLVTELMDESLMNFVNNSRDSENPPPYHVQVDIVHDVALALSYLHSRNIIHRDLSSNNVLLIFGRRAKVSDFGVSKFHDLQARYGLSRHLTTCPGTPIYMPPEAHRTPPTYTDKLDVFSWGVVCLHLLSLHDPSPGPGMTQATDSNGEEVFRPVPERQRRESEISSVSPDNSLLPVALHCIADKPQDRPTAHELCELLESLKHLEKYQQNQDRLLSQQEEQIHVQMQEETIKTLTAELHQLHEKESQQALDIKRLEELLATSAPTSNAEPDRETKLVNCLREKIQALEGKNRQKEHEISSLQAQADNLWATQSSVGVHSAHSSSRTQASVTSKTTSPKLKWKTIGTAPCHFERGSVAVVGAKVYLSRRFSALVHVFDTHSRNWSTIAPCPKEEFGLCLLDGMLAAVGGVDPGTGRGIKSVHCLDVVFRSTKWDGKKVPEMYYRRVNPGVATTEHYIIAVGGREKIRGKPTDTVEIFNISHKQWYSAYCLPSPLAHPSVTLCGETLYVTGGTSPKGPSKTVYHCPFPVLYQWSSKRVTPISVRKVWQTTQRSSPVSFPVAFPLKSSLALVGGFTSDEDSGNLSYSDYVFVYDKYDENEFTIVSRLPSARGNCLATVVGGKLLVMGGCGTMAVLESSGCQWL